MGKVLEDFTLERRGREGEKHDWDALLDGSVHELVEGKDFTTKLSTFRQKAGNAARDRSGHLESRTDGDKTIQIRFKNGKKK